MDNWHENLKRAKSMLVDYFNDTSKPVKSSFEELDDLLNVYESSIRNDEFYMLFDVRPNTIPIRWVSKSIKNVIGVNYSLSMEAWLSLIHPSFLKLYLEFARIAYGISVEYKEDLVGKKVSYSILIPVMNAIDGTYWLFKQSSIPVEFDENNKMIAHLNIYTRLNRFKKYTPSQPLIHFELVSPNHLEHKMITEMQKKVIGLFFSDLEKRHTRLLIQYWHQYSNYLRQGGEKPEAQFMSNKLKIKMTTIYKYSQEIIEHTRKNFPFAEFSDMVSVAEFLCALFGSIKENISGNK
ncbi:MAG: hypothetical protein AAFO82_00950 [Bacteroidota bacterium]